MSTVKKIIPALVLVISALTALAFIQLKPSEPNTGKGFAVVELFTSEGCSSCPPADALVAKIQKEYKDQQVYILAFHVDYWNRLGWKDGFSDAEYSKRQQKYAAYLNTSGPYTPQIVVNGKTEFVGSEEGTLRNAIKNGLQNAKASNLMLNNVKISGKQIALHYEAMGNNNNSTLLLALVQQSAQTNVKAGENSGRRLSHVQIVRKLQNISLNNGQSGTATITLPGDFNARGWEIIGLLQNTVNGEITGAAKTGISPAA